MAARVAVVYHPDLLCLDFGEGHPLRSDRYSNFLSLFAKLGLDADKRFEKVPCEPATRDDLERAFEPLEAQVVRGFTRRLREAVLMVVAEFDAEAPLLAMLAVLRASHDRNRYLPRRAMSTERRRRISTARIHVTAVQRKIRGARRSQRVRPV